MSKGVSQQHPREEGAPCWQQRPLLRILTGSQVTGNDLSPRALSGRGGAAPRAEGQGWLGPPDPCRWVLVRGRKQGGGRGGGAGRGLTRKDWKSWKEPTSHTYRWECTLVDVPLKALATARKE